MKTLDVICEVLLIVGGLNWLLVGAFEWNLVAALFGADTLLSRLVYILVGLSAVYLAIRLIQDQGELRSHPARAPRRHTGS